jgi:hypothetical protein
MRRPIPLRWIEEAEAREVRMLALCDRVMTPQERATAITVWVSLGRVSAWLVPGSPSVALTQPRFRGRPDCLARGNAETALPQRSSC